jgi:hemolysin-activating ACP:hemolysin acyltransferase
VVRTIDRSIANGQYYLLLHEGKALGAILWCEISAKTRDACLRENRGPTLDEALRSGDAIFSTATVARSPEASQLMWRLFARANKGRDILYQRHFRDAGRAARVGLIRGGRPVRG